MIKQIAAITFIYFCVCAAWMILGSTVVLRTGEQHDRLNSRVEQLWGSEQRQEAPVIYGGYLPEQVNAAAQSSTSGLRQSAKSLVGGSQVLPDSSKVHVGLNLEQRRKGLLWYPTYRVSFSGAYELSNTDDRQKTMILRFALPDKKGVYDNLKLSIGDKQVSDLHPQDGVISTSFEMPAHKSETLNISYDSMGVGSWRYTAGKGLTLTKKFKLDMETNFRSIDFPEGTRSPGNKVQTKTGWKLNWSYDNTMTGSDIGMSMPKLLNPGPLVSDVTFFAPVSLFFFFYVVWLTSTIRSVKLHPMHYFFVGAAFFSFHLLLAYSVDHIPVELSFFICSIVSVFLVMSYISRVIPDRHFVRQVGISQFIYLVLFSYTFFLEQFTGLIITCLSIMTLFVSMQYTVRVDWSGILSGKALSGPEDDLSLIEEAYGK